MIPALALVLAAALPAATLPAPSLARPSRGYALVVTNNRSLDDTRPDLRYADDDGAKYAELFSELFGEGHVRLLTAFDEETKPLYPAWVGRARPPSLEELDRAVATLAAALADERAQGRETAAYVVFAGHGDVENGQGYVELADGRLSARDLDERVVAKLPADRVHLVLDSCNSYFMLNPRKAGGKRWAARSDETAGLLAKYPHVGALVSTSAEALSYEWSDLQSGVFSYEVRSGLRGAADVDGDGKVSYAELAAFIDVANAPIVNDLYRPKIFQAPPRQDPGEAIVSLASSPRRLDVAASGRRRITLRDRNGVRVLDFHKEAGTALSLALPDDGEVVSVSELVDEVPGQRPRLLAGELPARPRVSLDDAGGNAPLVVARGEPPVFRPLFSRPFGREAFSRHEQALLAAAVATPSFEVSPLDAERLRVHLTAAASAAHDERLAEAATSFVAGGTGLLVGWSLAERSDPSDRGFYRGVALGAAGLLLGNGLLAAFGRSPAESFASEVGTLRLGPGSSGATVLDTERRLRQRAAELAAARRVRGFMSLGGGAVLLVTAGCMAFGADGMPQVRRVSPVLGLSAVVALVYGWYTLAFARDPLERASELSGADDALAVDVVSGPAGGAGVSVSGHF
jgi:hypothetical protein